MSRDRQDLASLLGGAKGGAADAPPFGRLWRAALERQDRRRFRRRLLLTAVSLSAAVLLVVVLVPAPGSRGPAPQPSDAAPPDAYELARSLSGWQAPLDFLLEPPGGGLLGLDSRIEQLRLLDDLSMPDSEEIL